MEQLIDIAGIGQIQLRRLGSGPKKILAIHGFSRAGSIFEGLARRLGRTHTLYAIDLPYHGGTQLLADRYSPDDIEQILRTAIEAMRRQGAGNQSAHDSEPIDLLGHSLGGRMLLKTLGTNRLSGENISSLTLVAPDGLRGNYTGKLDVIPSGVVKALAWAGGRKDAMIRIARFLHRGGLFDAGTLNYLSHHLKDKRTQLMLLGTFRSIPAFRLGRTERSGLARREIPTTVFLGSHDPLTNDKAVLRWFNEIPAASVEIYRGHHSLPTEELARHFEELKGR
jgi:pimeloyl-ACP methyl ester carboxylesterase